MARGCEIAAAIEMFAGRWIVKIEEAGWMGRMSVGLPAPVMFAPCPVVSWMLCSEKLLGCKPGQHQELKSLTYGLGDRKCCGCDEDCLSSRSVIVSVSNAQTV